MRYITPVDRRWQMTGLLLCPNCGHEAYFVWAEDGYSEWAQCQRCGVSCDEKELAQANEEPETEGVQ